MRSGSVNVMFITFGDFTLPSHFSQAFELLTVTIQRRRGAFNSP
jgi:hypothetical protein